MAGVGALMVRREGTLLGRQEELDAALKALGAPSGGVMIVGEAGVGKSSLARAAVAAVNVAADHEIIWLDASGSEPSVPFGVFAPIAAGADEASGHLADFFFRLQTVRKVILERADGRDLIIGVDDAHRLDDHSAALVHQLVSAGQARLVATLVSGGGGPAAMRSLWKDELVERIDLEPLRRGDAIDYARSLLDNGDLGGELAEALWRTSRGNPLYLRELVLTGRRSGRIAACDGVWRLDGDLTLGPRLAELVSGQLDAASSEELASLEALAFAGPLPLSVAERLIPVPHVAGLQRLRLLSVEPSRGEMTVRVRHPLFSQVLRQDMPSLRSSELSRRLASAFEADGRVQEELLRIVTWRLDADDEVPADVLLQASLQAASRQHWPLSARLAEAALAGGGGTEAALALADAYRALGRMRDAMDALGSVEPGGDDQTARASVLRAWILALGLGRFDEADLVLERAARRIADRSARTWAEAVRAGLICFDGRPADAVARCRTLLRRPGLDPRAELTVRAACALGRAWCGYPEDALRLLADAPLVGNHTGGWLPASWMKLTRILAFGQSGRIAELETLASDDYRLGVELGNRHLQGAAAGELAWAALLRGDLPRAVSRFREATAVFGVVGLPGNLAQTQIGLAEALAEGGDLAAAWAALEAAGPVVAGSAALGSRWQVAVARVEAAEGAVGQALSRLDEASRQARAAGMAGYEVTALHASVRLGSAAAARRLGELESAVGTPLIGTMAAHARALEGGERAGDLLDDIAEAYAGAELRLFAAEAAAQASQVHRRAGNHRRAATSTSRAHILLGDAAGNRPLALSMAMVPSALTRREGEVAMLAAGGLSSSTIAERLCLSVRTVDTHLARVYFKLGIGGRTELTPAVLSGGGPGGQVEAG